MIASAKDIQAPLPPDIKAKVTKYSELELEFTKEMVFPDEIIDTINESIGTGSEMISLVLLSSENDSVDETNLKHWTVISGEPTKITI